VGVQLNIVHKWRGMAELGVEEAAEIRELLIQWRFEHIDDYLERIDELIRDIRELAEPSGLDIGTLRAIREAQEAILNRQNGRER
jgi:hypothetical protein